MYIQLKHISLDPPSLPQCTFPEGELPAPPLPLEWLHSSLNHVLKWEGNFNVKFNL